MTPRVLIADEDSLTRQSALSLIRRRGYDVWGVTSGEEALCELARMPRDLVIADSAFPEMSGIDLLRQIRLQWPLTRVVLTSGTNSVDTAVQAMQAGADGFLTKPFDSTCLQEEVDRLLRLARHESHGVGASLAGIVTQEPQMLQLLETAARIAQSPAPILIQGDSGTGKELLAREIHLRSPRRDKPFVTLNCAAIPESLLESELFGHERGAFTGAIARRMGKFQMAHQGTLLLDEVSETSLQFQAKLLRTLQEGELNPVGRDRPLRVDVRVLATTNRCLREELQAGRFRQDLFFRLNVLSLRLLPLRERPGDIPLLARHFVEKHRAHCASIVGEVSEAALEHLARHTWPGNVRELESCIQRALLLCTERVLRPEHLHVDTALVPSPPTTGTRSEMERRLILTTLERCGGNRTRTAEALGISVRTIRNRLRQYREEAHLQTAPSAA
jgi:two-component system response regulator FlrC